MYSIRLQVRPYLAEYCSRKYSWPVSSACKVPPSSELYFLFLDLLSVRPPGAPIDRGNLEFILPNRSAGKRPDRFNYLSGRSQERLEQYLYVMFWAEFHRYAEYQIHVRGESLLMSVLLYKSKYCIESLSQEAFIKNYQRWRDRQSFLRRTYKISPRLL